MREIRVGSQAVACSTGVGAEHRRALVMFVLNERGANPDGHDRPRRGGDEDEIGAAACQLPGEFRCEAGVCFGDDVVWAV